MATKTKNKQKQQEQSRAANAKKQAEKKAKERREIVTLEFDDGVEQECFVEGVFDVAGEDYIALIPDDGSGDVYLYKYIDKGDDDDDFEIAEETDTAKFAAAVKEYEEIVGFDPAAEEKPKKKKK